MRWSTAAVDRPSGTRPVDYLERGLREKASEVVRDGEAVSMRKISDFSATCQSVL